jgi:hypothetical protein
MTTHLTAQAERSEPLNLIGAHQSSLASRLGAGGAESGMTAPASTKLELSNEHKSELGPLARPGSVRIESELAAGSVPVSLARFFSSVHLIASEATRAGGGLWVALRRLSVAALVTAVFSLVACTAVAGYWASFIGLHEFAMTHMGYEPKPAWLVPIVIDGAALGLSIAATVLAWWRSASPVISLLILGFTSVSSWINYQHITDAAGRKTASLLPFAAVILLEVLLSLLRRVRGDHTRKRASAWLTKWLHILLKDAAPREAAAGHLLLRAALHPMRAWILLRRSYTLPIGTDVRTVADSRVPAPPTATTEPTYEGSATPATGPAAARRSPARTSALKQRSSTNVAQSPSGRRIRADRATEAYQREEAQTWISQQHATGRQLTGDQVAAQFGKSPRWGRNQLDQYRTSSPTDPRGGGSSQDTAA